MPTMPHPFSDVLVPLDGSPVAERALRPAVELARRTGVPMRVMQRAFSDELDAAGAYLSQVSRSRGDGIEIEAVVADRDSIPDAILDARRPETLVCMSSHGRGGVTRAVIGSIAEAVLRTIDQPVLVIGPHVRDDAWFAGRVVACIDGSPASERTLGPARAWADALAQPLWLVSVADPGRPAEWTTGGDPTGTAPVARLAPRASGFDGWDVYRNRHPADELAERSASDDHPVGLLVMASHGRTGWDRLRLGSVTAGTVHAASVPVLVVPPALADGDRAGRSPAAISDDAQQPTEGP